MSQIGLMIYAVGIGAYSAGMFHFATHAVFKALLFMAAGNVIHALHDEQDIRLMGRRCAHGLTLRSAPGRSRSPDSSSSRGGSAKRTCSGFGTVSGPGMFPWLLYIVGVGVNLLTGLYAFRLYFTVFQGEPQTARVFAVKEAGYAMLIPVVILGALAVVVAWPLEFPLPNTIHVFSDFLAPVFAGSQSQLFHAPGVGLAAVGLIIGTVASLIGIGLAVRFWYEHKPDAQVALARIPRVIPLLSYNKFYFDEIYDRTLVRPMKAVARTARRVVS